MVNPNMLWFRFSWIVLLLISIHVIWDCKIAQSAMATLPGTVRDFKRGDISGGHPDFETYFGQDIDAGDRRVDTGRRQKACIC